MELIFKIAVNKKLYFLFYELNLLFFFCRSYFSLKLNFKQIFFTTDACEETCCFAFTVK
jgi:hypothetical protein